MECSRFYQLLFTSQFNFSALITITKSPVSVCGVNVGLFFPRSTLATTAERRPSGTSVASTTYHLRSTWPGFSHECCFVHDFSYMNIVFVYREDVPVHRRNFGRFGPFKWGKQYRLPIIPNFTPKSQ